MSALSGVAVRAATRSDLEAITRIYNHYVTASHVTFDTEPFSVEQRTPWFAQFDGARYQCWVAEHTTGTAKLAGYACSLPLKAKPAYGTSVEVSIYLDQAAGGRGVGTALYRALLAGLADQDLHRAYALIAQPNEASMRLHAGFGFEPIATLSEVGRKFDRYWDVTWLERCF